MKHNNDLMDSFLSNSITMFTYYKTLGDKTFEQLSEERMFWQSSKHDNSIALIVKHMWGNMMSRWTNLFTEDGEKEWRRREEEFQLEDIQTKEEVLNLWEEGWSCLFSALNNIEPANYQQLIYIRSKGHTILEAVQRQLTHYSYHVGQIVYLGKMIQGQHWESLSIAKGDSKKFTENSQSKGQRREHFTQEQFDDKLK